MAAWLSAFAQAQNGFCRFGGYHLAWVAAITALCIGAMRYAPCWTERTQRCAARGWTAAMAGSEMMRLAVLAAGGALHRGVLPLHLCSMAVWLCLLHAWTRWSWVGQTLYALCLPGVCAALLFPDWVMLPPWNYFCLHSFAIHGATAVYITAQTAAGVIRPRRAAWYQPALFLCAVLPVVYGMDRVWNVNYFFLLRPSSGSPLVWLGQWGKNWYLPSYAAGMLVLIWLMLTVGERTDRHRRSG